MIAPRTTSVIDLHHPVLWVGIALFSAGAARLVPTVYTALVTEPALGLLAFSLWTAYGVVAGLLIYRFEMFERRSMRTTSVAYLSGAILVAGIAMVAAPAMHGVLASLRGEPSSWDSAIAAPLVEEPLKMLVVVALAMIPGARVRSASDGLFFGVFVGLGFQVTENFLYSTQWSAQGADASVVLQTFVLRGFVTGLWSHATYTAITGAAVGYFFGSVSSPVRRWSVLLGSLGAAMLLHGFFNSPLIQLGTVPTAIIKGIPVLILALATLRWVHLRERRALHLDARDLVPDEHVSAVDFASLESRRERRRNRRAVAERFGPVAALAFARFQRAQLDALITAHDDGVGSVRYNQAIQELEHARRALEFAQESSSTGAPPRRPSAPEPTRPTREATATQEIPASRDGGSTPREGAPDQRADADR
ncbi:PrsW family intramembrane metalloprotease [Demequina salsinemoris]|uniref:PrsW family intramembrane metalloprotease n=1 Tax=Demequina salsinemoris TaxID=577470 RepID=UPI000786112A|nr:PrsW family intramembrane metalloprotease [Demequina salsinemoris]